MFCRCKKPPHLQQWKILTTWGHKHIAPGLQECSISSVVSDPATSWTVALQAPLFIEFSRQEHWSGLHFLFQGIFPTPRDQTHFSCISWIGRQILHHWATWWDLVPWPGIEPGPLLLSTILQFMLIRWLLEKALGWAGCQGNQSLIRGMKLSAQIRAQFCTSEMWDAEKTLKRAVDNWIRRQSKLHTQIVYHVCYPQRLEWYSPGILKDSALEVFQRNSSA